jgi:hypothetical protein
MEIKRGFGSRTLAIDGVPLPGLSHDEKALLGGTAPREYYVPVALPDATVPPDVRALCEFSVAFGKRLCPELRETNVPVYFYAPDGVAAGYAPKFRDGGTHVRLAADLRGEDAIRVALHEVRHVAQHLVPGMVTSPRKEADADAFAERWTEACRIAYRASDGYMSRLQFRSGRPPWAYDPSGTVIVSTSSARVYECRHANRGDPYTEVL